MLGFPTAAMVFPFSFSPNSPRRYLERRLETAYGDKAFKNIRWREVVAYARWHRAMRFDRSSPVVKHDIWD